MNELRMKVWNMFQSVLSRHDDKTSLDKIKLWMKLLGGIGIQKVNDCETARVSYKSDMVTIEIGAAFSDTLTTPEDWIWVIGHELSHFTLGHLNRIRRIKPFLNLLPWNYIYDVAIEARMFKQLGFGAPFEEGLRLKPLLKKSRGKSAAVGAFCVNPLVWEMAGLKPDEFLAERIKNKKLASRAIDFYYKLYPKNKNKVIIDLSAMTDELLFWLEGVVPIWLPIIGEQGKIEKIDRLADSDVEEPSEAGAGTVKQTERIQPVCLTPPKLGKEIAKILTFDSENSIKRREQVLVKTAMPFIGRKSATLLGSGIYPVFFDQKTKGETLSNFRPQVYVDLSGSMKQYLPGVYGLLKSLCGTIGEPVWGFSGDVVPLSLMQIKEGHVPITGGTELSPILKHAKGKRFSKIVIISDCFFFENNNLISELIRKSKIEVYFVMTFNYFRRRGYRQYDRLKSLGAKKVWTVDFEGLNCR